MKAVHITNPNYIEYADKNKIKYDMKTIGKKS